MNEPGLRVLILFSDGSRTEFSVPPGTEPVRVMRIARRSRKVFTPPQCQSALHILDNIQWQVGDPRGEELT